MYPNVYRYYQQFTVDRVMRAYAPIDIVSEFKQECDAQLPAIINDHAQHHTLRYHGDTWKAAPLPWRESRTTTHDCYMREVLIYDGVLPTALPEYLQ